MARGGGPAQGWNATPLDFWHPLWDPLWGFLKGHFREPLKDSLKSRNGAVGSISGDKSIRLPRRIK